MTGFKMAVTTSVLTGELDGYSSKDLLITNCCYSHLNTSNNFRDEWAQRTNFPWDNLGVTGSLQYLYEHTKAPLIAFLHSDLMILEKDWDLRVLKEFEDPSVGVVGFGGAFQLGSDDIYRTPYRMEQLARINFLSNMDDYQNHGGRMDGVMNVATLDGFALIVRRELLDKIGGWPVERYPFHNYDNFICMEASRQGYAVRLIGVRCHHYGGMTSTTPLAQEYWVKTLGKTDKQIHEESHLRLYEDGRGLLPLRAKR